MITLGRTLVGLVALGAAVAAVDSIVYQRQMTSDIHALLSDARRPTAPINVSEHDLQGVPEPVRRWLRYSQVVGRERPTTVRLRQQGEFQMDSRGWLPYKAEQYFTTDPPAFLWKASFRMLPLVSVVGRDSGCSLSLTARAVTPDGTPCERRAISRDNRDTCLLISYFDLKKSRRVEG